MITVYHGYHFGRQAKIAIEPHVHDPNRNVLPRRLMLYAAGLRKPNYPMPAIRQWQFWQYVHHGMRMADYEATRISQAEY